MGFAIVLDHIRGVHRGTRTLLDEDTELLGTGQNVTVHFPSRSQPGVHEYHGTLTLTGNDYLFAVEPSAPVRINGEPFSGGMLADGDLIELGDGSAGPAMRYRHVAEDRDQRFRSLSETLTDCVDCARISSDTPLGVAARVATELPVEMIARSAPGTRLVSMFLLGMLIVTVAWLGVRTIRIEQAISEQSTEFSEFSEAMSLFRSERSLSTGELDALRRDIDAAAERIDAVEGTPIGDILEEVSRSVVFVQGAFGFRDPAGRPLRQVVNLQGEVMRDARGQPLISPTAQGPIFTQTYTGTAFLVSTDGRLVTNRHVAIPWEFDPAAQRAMSSGLTPFMHRLAGYVPGREEPFDVALIGASDVADVAVLSSSLTGNAVRPVALSATRPSLGDRVLVLGYPTGVRALLARTSPAYIDELLGSGGGSGSGARSGPDPWELAAMLARDGHIAPLISEGIVAQLTPTAVVYDAATTYGGSGGPVLNTSGEVVAVNSAIVPEFGGANMGVPVAEALKLMDAPR